MLVSGDPEVERAASAAARMTRNPLIVSRTAHEAVNEFSRGFEDVGLLLVDLDGDVHGVTLFNALDDCHGLAPIVVITSYEEAYMKPLALDRGAVDCLGKPVSADCFSHLFESFHPSRKAHQG